MEILECNYHLLNCYVELTVAMINQMKGDLEQAVRYNVINNTFQENCLFLEKHPT